MIILVSAGPSSPIDVQALCNVVVWGTSLNPNGKIIKYEAEFFIPDTDIAIVRDIPEDRTFYIVEEEDKLGATSNTLVRVIKILIM